MHEALVNRLGGLSLPRKSVVRLTDRPDMTLDVYRGRKTTMQQQQRYKLSIVYCSLVYFPTVYCLLYFLRIRILLYIRKNLDCGHAQSQQTLSHNYSLPQFKVVMLVGWFGLNGPLRQYFSLYRAVSEREGERKEK